MALAMTRCANAHAIKLSNTPLPFLCRLAVPPESAQTPALFDPSSPRRNASGQVTGDVTFSIYKFRQFSRLPLQERRDDGLEHAHRPRSGVILIYGAGIMPARSLPDRLVRLKQGRTFLLTP